MNQEEFDAKFCYKPPPVDRQKKQIKKKARKCYEPCTSFQSLWRYIASFLPILTWLPAYSWKNELVNDAIGGFTVGILLVPQGIAYAVLAGVEPVYGLYSSFFPALIYMFLGTSKHCSIGPFSVVSLMAGIAIRQVLHPGENGSFDDTSKLRNSTSNETQSLDQLTPIEVATTLTLAIGLVQLLMAVLRLGFLTTYLSDQVVAGFTTAVAFHVFAAQLDDLLGIKIPHRNGFGYLFFEAYSIILALPSANIAAVVISTCSIVFLFVCKEFISPLFEKKIRVPIPSELLAVIFGTIISYYLQLNAKYKVEIVDAIPAGMPTPRVPQLDLIPSLLSNAVGIAIVIIAIHISLAKVFAKKHNYPIDAGQEIFAVGISECICSFFSVYPISTALARTTVNEGAGSKSLMASAFSCVMLLVLILWIGPLLEALPMSVLAAIIVVSLKGMIMKLGELKALWPLSKIDFMIWLVSFVATIVCDVMGGLAIAIAFALLTTVFRFQWPNWYSLKRLNGTSNYRDGERYYNALEESGIRIFRFDAPLLFYNVDQFKGTVQKAVLDDSNNADTGAFVKYLVIDCSGLTCVDCMGIKAIKETFDTMKKSGVKIYFAAAKDTVRDFFETNNFYKSIAKSNFYPTVSDAVTAAQNSKTVDGNFVNGITENSSNICRIVVGMT